MNVHIKAFWYTKSIVIVLFIQTRLVVIKPKFDECNFLLTYIILQYRDHNSIERAQHSGQINSYKENMKYIVKVDVIISSFTLA